MATPSRWRSWQARLTVLGWASRIAYSVLIPGRLLGVPSQINNDNDNNVTILIFTVGLLCVTHCAHCIHHFTLLRAFSVLVLPTFWAGWLFGVGRVVLCILGRTETSLASTPQLPVAHAPPPVVTAQTISRHCRTSPGRAKSPPVEREPLFYFLNNSREVSTIRLVILLLRKLWLQEGEVNAWGLTVSKLQRWNAHRSPASWMLLFHGWNSYVKECPLSHPLHSYISSWGGAVGRKRGCTRHSTQNFYCIMVFYLTD